MSDEVRIWRMVLIAMVATIVIANGSCVLRERIDAETRRRAIAAGYCERHERHDYPNSPSSYYDTVWVPCSPFDTIPKDAAK